MRSHQLIVFATFTVAFVLIASQFFAPSMALIFAHSFSSAFYSPPPFTKITLTNPNVTGATFGWSVAVEPGIVAVGAIGNAGASVYTFNVTSGALFCSLVGPAGGEFGYSLAISGSDVVVGAPYATVDGFTDAGYTYVYNALTCNLIRTLTSPSPQRSLFFGWSVSSTNSNIVVGAYGGHATGNPGEVYVFNAKTGDLKESLVSPHPQANGAFGWSVSLANGFVIVGAPHESVGKNESAGRAYAFDLKTSMLTRTFTDPNSQAGGEFGYSVATSGTIAVVGAANETINGHLDGSAYTYYVESGVLLAVLNSPNAIYGCKFSSCFGTSVGIKGAIVVIGAPGDSNDGGNTYPGVAYRFSAKTGALLNILHDRQCPADTCSGEHGFGYSVSFSSLDNGTAPVVVGAPYDFECQSPGLQVGLTYLAGGNSTKCK